MIAIIILLIITFFILAYYGLPEKINSNDFQEDPSSELIKNSADPFYFKGNTEVCFLLIHGFEGSPFTLRELGLRIYAEGHTVIAPLLPGHGTSIENFSKTRFAHWYTKARNTYLSYRPKFRKFFIIGFSMGGNIGLRLTSDFSNRLPVSGIVTISTPVFLNGFVNGRFYLKNWRLFFTGIIKLIMPTISKKKDHTSVKHISPWVGYSKVYSTSPVHSLKINIGKVRKSLKKIKTPLLCIHASNDLTVHSDNLHIIFQKVKSTHKHAYMFHLKEQLSTHHVLITHEDSKEKVYISVIQFVKDVLNDFRLTPSENGLTRCS